MGKVTKVVAHLTKEEIQEHIKETTGFWKVQKWLVILNATVDPRPAEEIAQHTGLAKQTVHNLISQYNRHGPDALTGPGKGGRYRANLSLDEEESFLSPFKTKALAGQIATAKEIHIALEDRIGRAAHISSTYRLLKRHGWRKVVPRPQHVQANLDEQEAFKKISKTG
ncbi:MAG: winged helix-turn-helix domain-containing protein [Magnetococcales bacterium]|nr:winged helix-turn-helix domain-containing protein [Magnetococcales bacterium]